MKPQIRLVDQQFVHAPGGMGNGDIPIYPSFFSWCRGTELVSPFVVLTEASFDEVGAQPEKVKMGVIIEPKSISPLVYTDWYKRWMSMNFDHIFSHSVEFISRPVDGLSPKCQFHYYPLAGTWIPLDQWGVYPKTKRTSIIVSEKCGTLGQRLRHDVVSALTERFGIDVYGRGYRRIGSKLEALRDYRYSIIIENEQSEGWFTEKLIDCFACGTIPLYWGDPSVETRFSSVQTFSDLVELEKLLVCLDRCPGVPEDNLRRARAYAITEDWLWTAYWKRLYESYMG